MKISPLKDVKDNFSRHIRDCQRDHQPLLVTKDGRPAVLLVPVAEDADVESLVLAWSPQFRRFIEESRERRRHGDSLPFSDLKAELLAEEPPQEPQAASTARRSRTVVRQASSAPVKKQAPRQPKVRAKAHKTKS